LRGTVGLRASSSVTPRAGSSKVVSTLSALVFPAPFAPPKSENFLPAGLQKKCRYPRPGRPTSLRIWEANHRQIPGTNINAGRLDSVAQSF
jgi:hypothetical protein